MLKRRVIINEYPIPIYKSRAIRPSFSTAHFLFHMAYYRSNTSIFDGFSLNPLPYPVLLILGVISLFLALQWYVSYESVVEATEESMGWLLMAAPLLLLFAVKWLSTSDNPASWWFYASSPWDTRRTGYYLASNEGGSPWGVAALILLLLVLMQYQSSFLETWFV